MLTNPIFERAEALGVDPKTLMMLDWFAEAIAKDPNDAQAYYSMGQWWHRKEEYAKALEHLNKAIELKPNFDYALCRRADLRATCPDGTFRNGSLAVADATLALQLAAAAGLLKNDWQHRMFLRIVAAAFAEAGDFHGALQVESELLGMAITNRTIGESQKRIESYRAGRPMRCKQGLM